ncbi:MAG: hypothetical protein JXK93_14225 [Sphaerochaetaceae bacterium]|nr:hypothetical protein [Sphaerochaetaceae bacterium]
MSLPMIFWIRFRDDQHSFKLWIPLILLYILLLPLALVVLFALPFLYLARNSSPEVMLVLRFILSLPALFGAMTGTEIDIQSEKTEISMYIR